MIYQASMPLKCIVHNSTLAICNSLRIKVEAGLSSPILTKYTGQLGREVEMVMSHFKIKKISLVLILRTTLTRRMQFAVIAMVEVL